MTYMKTVLLALLAVGLSSLAGCASAPPTLPTDTLVYFTIDIEELPGSFVKAVFFSTDKQFSVGTAWDNTLKKNIVVAYVSVPHDKPTYFAEIHADDSGILTGRKYNMYVMTVQESPFKVAKTSAKASIKYGGAFKFRLIDPGLFKSNKFLLERCITCPTEKDVLQHMVKISKEGGGLLNENDYVGKIKARLKSL